MVFAPFTTFCRSASVVGLFCKHGATHLHNIPFVNPLCKTPTFTTIPFLQPPSLQLLNNNNKKIIKKNYNTSILYHHLLEL